MLRLSTISLRWKWLHGIVPITWPWSARQRMMTCCWGREVATARRRTMLGLRREWISLWSTIWEWRLLAILRQSPWTSALKWGRRITTWWSRKCTRCVARPRWCPTTVWFRWWLSKTSAIAWIFPLVSHGGWWDRRVPMDAGYCWSSSSCLFTSCVSSSRSSSWWRTTFACSISRTGPRTGSWSRS